MPLVQPYAAQHSSLHGPGDQRPTAEQVIRDQNLVGGLPGLNILITGCTSGIGIETARVLYLTGANIYITARNMDKGQEVAAELSTDASRPVKVIQMSLDSFASIRKGAADLLSQTSRLNILINNAGIMATPEGKTVDGFELQFGTNHLGHFLLFQLLKPALLAAATPERLSRVISVSSTGHRNIASLDFSNLDFSKHDYKPMLAYGNSKLANIYFANELTRRYQKQNLIGLSLHPGSIETPLRRHLEVQGGEAFRKAVERPEYQAQLKSTEQGAATSVWAAVGKEWTHRGGVYLEDVGEAGPVEVEGPSWRPGYSPAAYRPEDERRLWEMSEKWCGV
jgi:NAD(P)-dependent dehydrogenase (short-subunit alcohol dehydrogenase family)